MQWTIDKEHPQPMKLYGCLFCITGKEFQVARSMETNNAHLRALPLQQRKRKTSGGRTQLVDVISLPGYVFFEADDARPLFLPYQSGGLISLLKQPDGDWHLYGEDQKFARWLFSHNGLIAFSEAYKEGDRIKILSGPLKELEGSIVRIDKRNRNGQVALRFQNRVIKIWLGYELLENLP